jgi:hypothetical protein
MLNARFSPSVRKNRRLADPSLTKPGRLGSTDSLAFVDDPDYPPLRREVFCLRYNTTRYPRTLQSLSLKRVQRRHAQTVGHVLTKVPYSRRALSARAATSRYHGG